MGRAVFSLLKRRRRAGLCLVEIMFLAGAILGVGLTRHTAQPAAAAGPCEAPGQALDGEELRFIASLNAYRAEKGLRPLSPSANLARSADWMARDMATHRYFGHQDSLGRDAVRRAADCGYAEPMGENLAAGTAWDTAAEALQAWKDSPAHNENMLLAVYVQIGVARYYDAASPWGWYWVTDFGVVDDGSRGVDGDGRAAAAQASPSRGATAAGGKPFWVNDSSYGAATGGFYWDPVSGEIWTGIRGWHAFAPQPRRTASPLWVDDAAYCSAGAGFYWDPVSGLVWVAERGWRPFDRACGSA